MNKICHVVSLLTLLTYTNAYLSFSSVKVKENGLYSGCKFHIHVCIHKRFFLLAFFYIGKDYKERRKKTIGKVDGR